MNAHVNTYEPRPCYAIGRKALFHGWYHEYFVVTPSPMIGGPPGGQKSNLWAIVEYEDGSCDFVSYDRIMFIDHGKFDEIAWPEPEEKTDD